MKYEIRSLQTGQIHCAADRLDRLCPACRARVTTPTVAAAHEQPPDPPSLSAACGGKVVDYPPTYIFGRPESRPLVAASTGVPEPPSLIDACKAQKETKR